jgi:hypothetical protein
MTDPHKYEAVNGEWETVPGFLFFGPDAEQEVVNVRVFKEQGDLVRLDVSRQIGLVPIQLVIGASALQRLIADPQALHEDEE